MMPGRVKEEVAPFCVTVEGACQTVLPNTKIQQILLIMNENHANDLRRKSERWMSRQENPQQYIKQQQQAESSSILFSEGEGKKGQPGFALIAEPKWTILKKIARWSFRSFSPFSCILHQPRSATLQIFGLGRSGKQNILLSECS